MNFTFNILNFTFFLLVVFLSAVNPLHADCDDPLLGGVDSVVVSDGPNMPQATITGWVIRLRQYDSPTALQVVIDGVPMRSGWLDPNEITLGLARPDVAEGFNRPDLLLAGFRITLPLLGLSKGIHAIQIMAMDDDGVRHALPAVPNATQFYVNHPACCSTDSTIALGLMPIIGILVIGGLGVLLFTSKSKRKAVKDTKHFFSARPLRLRGLPVFALSLIFPVTVVWLIASQSVNIPFFDEWEFAKLLLQFHEGGWQGITWTDLWVQHNEHRLLIARLIFLASTQVLGEWNPQHFMWLTFALACIFWGLLCCVLWRNFAHTPTLRGLAIVVVSAMTFSLAQHENWLWGFQYPWWLVNVLAVITLQGINRYANSTKMLLLAITLAGIATFTNGSGLALWPAGGVILAGRQPKQLWRLGLWLAAMLVILQVYAIGYVAPLGIPDPFLALENWDFTITFLLTLLGSTWWAAVGEEASQAAGWFGMGVLTLLIIWQIWLRRAAQQDQPKQPNIFGGMLVFGLANALSTSLGRSGFGLDYALTGRYQATLICFWIGLVLLIFAQLAEQRFISPKHGLGWIVIAMACVPLLLGFAHTQAQAHTAALLRAQFFKTHIYAVYAYGNVCNAALSPFYTQVSVIRQVSAKLDRHALGPFSPTSRAINTGYLR